MKIHDYYKDKNNLSIVCELLEGGELFDRISELKKFGEKEAADVM